MRVVAAFLADGAEGVERAGESGIVGAQCAFEDRNAGAELRFGLGVAAEAEVRFTDVVAQLGLDGGLSGKGLADLRDGRLQRFENGGIAPRASHRVGRAQRVQEELLDGGGLGGFLFGPGALPGNARRQDGHDGGESGQQQEQPGREGEAGLVAEDQLAKLIERTGGLSLNGLAGHVAGDVLGQGGDALVPQRRLLFEGLGDDGGEILVDRPGAGPGSRERRRHGRANHGDRLEPAHAVDVERGAAGDHLIEDHAQRVDVGAGVYFVGIASDLLRTQVGEGALDLADLGLDRGRGQVGVGDACQTEVQDLDGGDAGAGSGVV